MENIDYEYIESLTNFSEKGREDLVRYYGKLPEGARLLVHDFAGQYAAKNRYRMGDKKSEFYYAAFLIGAARLKYLEKKKDRKVALDDSDAALAKQINIARIDAKFREKSKKPSPLKARIEKKYFGTIHEFRTAENPKDRRSWRWIIRYLADNHKIKVSYSYLIRCYEEILEEKSLEESL